MLDLKSASRPSSSAAFFAARISMDSQTAPPLSAPRSETPPMTNAPTPAGMAERFEHGGCRVQDIAYTAFMLAKQPNDEDGGPTDWFNDTWPTIKALIAAKPSAGAVEALREALVYARAHVVAGSCSDRQQCLDQIDAALAPVAAEGGEKQDAERFRALMRCGRIKMQGSSGVDPHTGERNGNNVHFGAEFWPEPIEPEWEDTYRAGTTWGRACLKALADAILEQEAALRTEPAGGGEG